MSIHSSGSEPRQRLCILSTRLQVGGITNVLVDALKVLQDRYDITIICFGGENTVQVQELFPENVAVVHRNLPSGGFGKLLSRLPWISGGIYRKALGDEMWDQMVVLRPTLTNAVYARRAKLTVFWCHNDHHRGFLRQPLPVKKRIAKFLRRAVYRKYDQIWAVSELVAREMGDCFGLKHVYALPNPLDCRAVEAKALQPCDTVFDSETINLIMIGRMSSEKGFQRVLRFMCREVLAKYPQTRLYLMGNDTDAPQLKQRMEQLGMADRVVLLGVKENPYPYLRQAQCLICPSVSESFGLVMLEAMLLGVHVITTDTIGGTYVTQNGVFGCCVPNSDDALQAAVEAYLENPGAYAPDIERARLWAEAHDISRFGDRLLQLLR